MIRLAIIAAAAASAVLLGGSGVAAQSYPAVVDARRAGVVGERFDGYMGFAGAASETVRAQVRAINIRRRALYTNLSMRRGVTVQVAGLAAGCTLLSRVAVGEVYMLGDRTWRRRSAGAPPPQPEHCRQPGGG